MQAHVPPPCTGPRRSALRRSAGFTLIELMTVLAVIVIFATLAGPSFSSFIAGQRVKAAAYDISSMLTLARSEALKRNANVVVAPANGGWQNGWNVSTGTGTSTVALLQHEALNSLVISGPAPNLTYNSSGRLTGAVSPFSISSGVNANVPARCVTLDLSGLPSSKTGSC